MPVAPPSERRSAARYDLHLDLRFILYGQDRRAVSGTGTTVNLSSSGMLFQTDQRALWGDWIKAAVNWPVPSPEGEPLVLVVSGHVTRTKARSTAILMEKRDLISLRTLEQCKSAPPEKIKSYPVQPIVLVNDDNRSFAMLSAVLRESSYPVYRTESESIKSILASGFPPVRLVWSNSLKPVAGIAPGIPVIFTGGTHASFEYTPQLDTSQLIVVNKPLFRDRIREVVAPYLFPQPAPHIAD